MKLARQSNVLKTLASRTITHVVPSPAEDSNLRSQQPDNRRSAVCEGAVDREQSAKHNSSIMASDRLGQRTFEEAASTSTVANSMIRGIDHMRDPRLNKGMAFTLEERQALGIHGLIPPRFKTQEEQLNLCQKSIDRYTEDLNKYIYLMGLQDRNERLFYRFLSENVEKMMPIVYTPTVGKACQKYGLIYRRPRGLFITIHDKGHIYDILKNWPESDVRAIVVTDGERILGLGDLGAYGMGIPVGKLALYTALANIKPHQCLPITLDVGTNNKELRNDDLYIGLKHERVRGQAYDEFIDEFMQAVVKRYGQNTLIQFEDFGNENAFKLLHKYQMKYCTFNDDIQGTASVAVAGLLASLKITNTKLKDNKFVFQGAGEAALGIASLIVMAMVKEGISEEEAKKRIFLFDSRGLIVKNRPSGGISEHKAKFAQAMDPIDKLHEVVKKVKPSVIIGAAAQKGAFTPEIIAEMANINKRPVIFALSNPTSLAECTAEEAYTHSKGTAIFASGSPFDKVVYNGKEFTPGQGNNAYIFPGVALGVICAGVRHITDDVFLTAAETLSGLVSQADRDKGSLYPPLTAIKDCSIKIAVKVVEGAYEDGSASVYPKPKNIQAFVTNCTYNYEYKDPVLPKQYSWPKSAIN
ncbi:hypothetical protein LSTR_LSTR011635 [Laodelphax striatellus]|uniref:Malic enzyme n=1 Tax=Laodelphax striatellus TaxID=195883 RepID=A0A482X8B1_LAOST|nr:hypothetical protein LSTR_LSTR011635 [Laodelphax striatellus]